MPHSTDSQEAVPHLILSVKAAGLLLITSGVEEVSSAGAAAAALLTASPGSSDEKAAAVPDGHARPHLLVCRS